MFNLIKLENLVESHSKKGMSKKLTSGICYVYFKRSVIEEYFYRFAGYCISARNRGISSTFIVRNVLKSDTIEYTFHKHSPLIDFFFSRIYLHYKRKSKLYFLRKKPTPWSRIPFNYVT
jgi:ribosomal protein L19